MDIDGLLLKYKVNRPLTEEEIEHHLPQSELSSSKPWYALSVIKMNSTFLECVDKFYEEKGWGVIHFVLFSYIGLIPMSGPFGICEFINEWWAIQGWDKLPATLGILLFLCFPIYGFWEFQREIRYTHYPIRFNRKTRKVHVFRRDGTVMTEDWDRLYFTVGPHGATFREVRGHRLAEDGKTVLETFGLPWDSKQGAFNQFSQWEFVRRYMEEGPEERRSLFQMVEVVMPIADRRENLFHGFLRFYGNFLISPFYALLGLPMALILTPGRWVVMYLAKIPKWPPEVEADSQIEPNDPYILDAPPRGKRAPVWNYATNARHVFKPFSPEDPDPLLDRDREKRREQFIKERTRELLIEAGMLKEEPSLALAAPPVHEKAVQQEPEYRFGQDTAPELRASIAEGLFHKGITLKWEDKQAAINIYDELDRRFGQDTAPAVRKWVAKALLHKGDMLKWQDEQAAKAVYEELVRRFGQDTAQEVRESVEKACNNVASK